MAFFVSSEEKRRFRHADALLNSTREAITDKSVEAALPDWQHAIHTLLDEHFYIPNVTQGIIKRPKTVRNDDSVPVVVVRPNESLRLDYELGGQTASQRRSLESFLNENLADEQRRRLIQDAVEANLKHERYEAGGISVRPGSLGRVIFGATPMSFTSDVTGRAVNSLVIGRPIFVMGTMQKPKDAFTGVLGVHESVHAFQALTDSSVIPAGREAWRDAGLRQELEAYHVQVIAAQALYSASGNPRFYENKALIPDGYGKIEEIRREINESQEDPFYPSAEITIKLAQLGLSIVSDLEPALPQ